jgi:hypothetical protein
MKNVRPIRYMYLRDCNKNPIGCIAIFINRDAGLLDYQVSVVNPLDRKDRFTGKDLPFHRAMARQLACGRLVEDGLCLPMNRNATMNEISMLVMKDLASCHRPMYRGDIPSRAIKAAKHWLESVNNQRGTQLA